MAQMLCLVGGNYDGKEHDEKTPFIGSTSRADYAIAGEILWSQIVGASALTWAPGGSVRQNLLEFSGPKRGHRCSALAVVPPRPVRMPVVTQLSR